MQKKQFYLTSFAFSVFNPKLGDAGHTAVTSSSGGDSSGTRPK